jgi:hypothetical protein
VQKRLLGITWDEIPSLAFHSKDGMILPYPQGRSISVDELYYWFEDIRRKRVQPLERPDDIMGFS